MNLLSESQQHFFSRIPMLGFGLSQSEMHQQRSVVKRGNGRLLAALKPVLLKFGGERMRIGAVVMMRS
jgi:hypothetical protein